MNAFTIAFLAALATATALRLWLAARHVRFVRAHRGAVPREFAPTVSLAAHQKAADYTAAKTRLGALEALVSAGLVLALTLGGGCRRCTTCGRGRSSRAGMRTASRWC